MPRTARRPFEWLAVGIGVVAALTWTSVAVRAVVMDDNPSVKGLVGCAALVLVGVALGPAAWILSAPIRAKRSPAEAAGFAEMRAAFAMLGIMVIGMGVSPIVDPSPSAWDWALMVLGSLTGGLNLSFAFMSVADQRATSGSLHDATGTPRPGG